jgi:hypothetical protein
VSEVDTLKHVEELYERYFGERSEIALSEVAEVASSPLGEEDREGSRT